LIQKVRKPKDFAPHASQQLLETKPIAGFGTRILCTASRYTGGSGLVDFSLIDADDGPDQVAKPGVLHQRAQLAGEPFDRMASLSFRSLERGKGIATSGKSESLR